MIHGTGVLVYLSIKQLQMNIKCFSQVGMSTLYEYLNPILSLNFSRILD